MKKLIIGTIILMLLLIMAGCEEEKPDYEWSTMNYQCNGWGEGDISIGRRCKNIGKPNIRNKYNRSWYYCPEHYKQSELIEGRIERY